MQQLMEACVIMEQHLVHHFDIKPENIMIDWPEGHDMPVIKIIDFGFSEHYNENQERSCNICTNYYRPPELYRQKGAHRSYGLEVDLWSIGVVLAEYYEKRHLFRGEDDDAILTNVRDRLKYGISHFDAYYGFGPDFGYMVSNFINLDPEQRWETYLHIRSAIYKGWDAQRIDEKIIVVVDDTEGTLTRVDDTEYQHRMLADLPTTSQIETDHKCCSDIINLHTWYDLVLASMNILNETIGFSGWIAPWTAFYRTLILYLEQTDLKSAEDLYVTATTILFLMSQIYCYRAMDRYDFVQVCRKHMKTRVSYHEVKHAQLRLVNYL
jgi:serine/threonine protein kinase